MENTVYGYVAPHTLPLLGESPTLDRLFLLASGDRFNEAHVRRVAGDVKAWLESTGHAVTRVIVPPPGEHPHAAIMGLLLLAMSLLGLVILGLSAIIVCTVTLSTLARQRRQIGVMKAVGGTRGQIAAIYLAEAGMLGAAAIVAGMLAGLAGNRALTSYLARLLNFDVTSWTIPAWVYLLVALVGLAAPLLAAAWPVAMGTAMTVREALSELPASHARRAGRPDGRPLPAIAALVRGAGLVRPALPRSWWLGLQNAFRRPARTALTLVTMTIGGASFMAAVNVRTSMMQKVDELFGAGTFGSADRYAIDQHMVMIYSFLLIAAGVLTLVGSLGLMTATSLNVLDRRRELGVLRTIGASPLTIAGVIISEPAFVACCSWLFAIGAAWPLSVMLGRMLRTIFFRNGFAVRFWLPGVAAWLIVAAAVSVASSIVPALLASRRSIREAISYE